VYLPETRSDFVVPLLVGEQVIGVLNLEADQEDYFTADHERVMTSLGFQLAVAITNALRFEQLHQMNEELVKLDRLRSEFLASVSHELRTPLNAVINFNQFVSSGLHGPVNERQIDALNKSTNSARHLLSLINDVLDMSKIESGRLELFIEPDVDLSAELIEVAEITRSLIDQKPITVTLDLDTKIPLVRADKRRIRQVLLNITSNAVKFTDEGRITIGASASGQEVIISVRDTGPGIPKDDHQRVFEAFHQLDRDSHATGGTGLGLAISKRLIEGQKGKLWLESIPGQGATFYVSMPVSKTAVKPNGDD
jgi:signal transduction histidine kinase